MSVKVKIIPAALSGMLLLGLVSPKGDWQKKGDLTRRLAVESEDEIGQLSICSFLFQKSMRL